MLVFYLYRINPSSDDEIIENSIKILESQYDIKIDDFTNISYNHITLDDLSKISREQGLITPKINPLNERLLLIFEQDEKGFRKLLTFYPQKPAIDNEKMHLKEISVVNFLHGLQIQVVLIAHSNSHKDLIFQKISHLKRKTPESNLKWYFLDY